MATILTFDDLFNEVLNALDEAGDTGTTLTLAKQFINQAQTMRLAQEPWPFLRWDGPETLTLTVGERFYTLHPEFWRPDYFYNRTSKEALIEVPAREIYATGERWPSDTGRTPFFRWAGLMPVADQPSAASVVTIVSTSASDNTAGKAITVEGIVSGVRRSESITPNGTTPVAGTLSFTKVLRVTKGADWAGTMTMTSNGGAITLLTLLPTEYGRSYRQLELLRSPTSADTIEYVFFRLPTKLVNDNDIPDIPHPHSMILVWDALLMFAGYNTELEAKQIKLWGGMQADMEADMRRLWLEGTAQGARPRSVRHIDDEGGWPRIFTE